MQLSVEQKRRFVEDGYLHLPGLIPEERVAAALRAINHSLGEGMDPAHVEVYRSQSYCPELCRSPVILDLLRETPLWAAAEDLVGAGRVQEPWDGQIALRFPSLAETASRPEPHLDGMYTPTNGVPEGTLYTFSALAGVFLSDLPETEAGNFTVWPGTHRLYEAYFRQHGPEALLNGMPDVSLPEPVQIRGRAGDAVLCHYQLAHAAAANRSPHVRYAVYYRLLCRDHQAHWREAMTDIWREWRGVPR